MSVSRSWQDAEEIRGAFRLFDGDSSGTITPEELMAILTRPDTGNTLSLADAKEIIASFDTDGDGNLGLDEFVQAWTQIGNDVEKNEAFQLDVRYEVLLEPHRAKIKAMFNRLDVDGSGQLSIDEFRNLVIYYSDGEYDEVKFLQWYDTSKDPNQRQDGLISVTEFGWWVADSADLEDSRMLRTMDKIDKAITRTLSTKTLLADTEVAK